MRAGTLTKIKRLSQRRTANGVSTAAGLSRSYVSKFESGDIAEPSLRAFARIAKELGLNPHEVFLAVMLEAQDVTPSSYDDNQ